MVEPIDLTSTFMVFDPDLICTEAPVTPTLYADLDLNFHGFRSCLLVSEYSFNEDWPTWEVHPKGDELLYLLSGECSIHLLIDGIEQIIPFVRPGSTIKVPKGTWHTAKMKGACRMLFITPGEGTENRPSPSGQNA
ncbi:MAG: cupin domain-containing protein [Acidobacteria bacterium]|nr:cupin domain-containing protein [Acidobacteriota bacterium]